GWAMDVRGGPRRARGGGRRSGSCSASSRAFSSRVWREVRAVYPTMSVKTMARFSVLSAAGRASASEGDGEVVTEEGGAPSGEDVMVVVGPEPEPAEGSSAARSPGPVGTRVTGDDLGADRSAGRCWRRAHPTRGLRYNLALAPTHCPIRTGVGNPMAPISPTRTEPQTTRKPSRWWELVIYAAFCFGVATYYLSEITTLEISGGS